MLPVPHLWMVIAIPPAMQLQVSWKGKYRHVFEWRGAGWETLSREERDEVLLQPLGLKDSSIFYSVFLFNWTSALEINIPTVCWEGGSIFTNATESSPNLLCWDLSLGSASGNHNSGRASALETSAGLLWHECCWIFYTISWENWPTFLYNLPRLFLKFLYSCVFFYSKNS